MCSLLPSWQDSQLGLLSNPLEGAQFSLHALLSPPGCQVSPFYCGTMLGSILSGEQDRTSQLCELISETKPEGFVLFLHLCFCFRERKGDSQGMKEKEEGNTEHNQINTWIHMLASNIKMISIILKYLRKLQNFNSFFFSLNIVYWLTI